VVLILISTKQFLRSGEATGDTTDPTTGRVTPTGLTDHNFVKDLFVVSPDGSVEALAIKVKGITLIVLINRESRYCVSNTDDLAR
jgi:hypothetical protein